MYTSIQPLHVGKYTTTTCIQVYNHYMYASIQPLHVYKLPVVPVVNVTNAYLAGNTSLGFIRGTICEGCFSSTDLRMALTAGKIY